MILVDLDPRWPLMTSYDQSSFRYKDEASGQPASEVGKSKTESWNGKKNERNGFTCGFYKEPRSNFRLFWPHGFFHPQLTIWPQMTPLDLATGGENQNWFKFEANGICSKVLWTSSELKTKNLKLKMKQKWNGKRTAISYPCWPIHKNDSYSWMTKIWGWK